MFSSICLFAGLSGIFGGPLGRGGILGPASRSAIGGCRIGRTGADFVETRGALAALATAAFSSTSLLVGGRGGSLASPNAGGSFLCESTDDTLDIEDP